MKKLLALVLAVLMLASLAIASVSAEDELVKLETIIEPVHYGVIEED